MENNGVPVYDLSEMDKIDNNRVENKFMFTKEGRWEGKKGGIN